MEDDKVGPHRSSAGNVEIVKRVLETVGAIFEEDGQETPGGPGVRLDHLPPSLFRRDPVDEKEWIAFAFDYRGNRYIGFAHYDALAPIALSNLSPREVFDRETLQVLRVAASLVDKHAFDDEGRIHITRGDLNPETFRPVD
jgi:hypothetical protein